MAFTKLDDGIVFSSIMGEDDSVFRVWIILLATCKQDGVSRISPVFLSTITKKPPEEIIRCLDILKNPDICSRSKNDEGRRIELVDGGFKIINYEKYRESSKTDYLREKQGMYRYKKNCIDTVSIPSASSSVSDLNPDKERTIIYSSMFNAFWSLYPKKVAKDQAWKTWQKLKLGQDDCTAIAAALEWQKVSPQWVKDSGQFIPHPSTYLNSGGWKDEKPAKGAYPFRPDPCLFGADKREYDATHGR